MPLSLSVIFFQTYLIYSGAAVIWSLPSNPPFYLKCSYRFLHTCTTSYHPLSGLDNVAGRESAAQERCSSLMAFLMCQVPSRPTQALAVLPLLTLIYTSRTPQTNSQRNWA